jgi:hypothetical protein
MKLRTGFVSNSSSSSFVVATKGDKTEIKLNLTFNLGGRRTEVISTLEKLDDYYKRAWGLPEDKSVEEGIAEHRWLDEANIHDYRERQRLIREGYKIYCGDISYECCDDEQDAIEQVLYYKGFESSIEDSEDVVVLEG